MNQRTPIVLVLYVSAYDWLTTDTEVVFPADTRPDRINAAAKRLGLPCMGLTWLSRGELYSMRKGEPLKVGHQVGYGGPPGPPIVPESVRHRMAERQRRRAHRAQELR